MYDFCGEWSHYSMNTITWSLGIQLLGTLEETLQPGKWIGTVNCEVNNRIKAS